MEGIEMHGAEEGCRRKCQGHLGEGHKGKGLERDEKWRREIREQGYDYSKQYNH